MSYDRQPSFPSKPKLRRAATAAVFVLPALILYVVFEVVPMLRTVSTSLYVWNGYSSHIRFIGLGNYVEAVTDYPLLWQALKNVAFLALVLTFAQNAVSLCLALLLNVRLANSFYKTAFYLPNVLMSVVVGFTWTMLYDPLLGPINRTLKAIGLSGWAQPWLAQPGTALIALIITIIWQNMGFGMVVYLAALKGIPAELLEAARMDGANAWQRFRNVTWPLLASANTIMIVLTLIGSFRIFDQVYVMTMGGPANTTVTLAFLIIREAFQTSRMGFGAALSVILFVMTLALSLVQISVLRRREVQY